MVRKARRARRALRALRALKGKRGALDAERGRARGRGAEGAEKCGRWCCIAAWSVAAEGQRAVSICCAFFSRGCWAVRVHPGSN